MEVETLYTVLGLCSTTCSMAEVRSAYRRVARSAHPDRNSTTDTTQKMVRVNEAKDILLDQEARVAYNRKHGFPLIWRNSEEYRIQEKFYDEAGSQTFKNHIEEAPPIVFHRDITYGQWSDPNFRMNLDLTFNRTDICTECLGYTWKPMEQGTLGTVKICTHCSGEGYIIQGYTSKMFEKKRKRMESTSIEESALPVTASIKECTTCKGTGDVPTVETKECTKCSGKGQTREPVTLNLRVRPPVHIDRVTRTGVLCIQNAGDRFRRKHRRGDVHIIVHVNPIIQIPVKLSDYIIDDGHDCELQGCILTQNGLCVQSFPIDNLFTLGPGDVQKVLSFSPSTDGNHLDTTITIGHDLTLRRFRMIVPTSLREIDEIENGIVSTISIEMTNTIGTVLWNGDQWILPEWGPRHCPYCDRPSFVNEYASHRRDLSRFIPTFAPSTFYDIDRDMYTCPFGNGHENHSSFGDMRITFHIGRPGEGESTMPHAFRFPSS